MNGRDNAQTERTPVEKHVPPVKRNNLSLGAKWRLGASAFFAAVAAACGLSPSASYQATQEYQSTPEVMTAEREKVHPWLRERAVGMQIKKTVTEIDLKFGNGIVLYRSDTAIVVLTAEHVLEDIRNMDPSGMIRFGREGTENNQDMVLYPTFFDLIEVGHRDETRDIGIFAFVLKPENLQAIEHLDTNLVPEFGFKTPAPNIYLNHEFEPGQTFTTVSYPAEMTENSDRTDYVAHYSVLPHSEQLSDIFLLGPDGVYAEGTSVHGMSGTAIGVFDGVVGILAEGNAKNFSMQLTGISKVDESIDDFVAKVKAHGMLDIADTLESLIIRNPVEGQTPVSATPDTTVEVKSPQDIFLRTYQAQLKPEIRAAEEAKVPLWLKERSIRIEYEDVTNGEVKQYANGVVLSSTQNELILLTSGDFAKHVTSSSLLAMRVFSEQQPGIEHADALFPLALDMLNVYESDENVPGSSNVAIIAFKVKSFFVGAKDEHGKDLVLLPPFSFSSQDPKILTDASITVGDEFSTLFYPRQIKGLESESIVGSYVAQPDTLDPQSILSLSGQDAAVLGIETEGMNGTGVGNDQGLIGILSQGGGGVYDAPEMSQISRLHSVVQTFIQKAREQGWNDIADKVESLIVHE